MTLSVKSIWLRSVKMSRRWLEREPIEIPETLIEKLKPFGPRFIKIESPIPGDSKTGKGAVEHRWQTHPYTAEEMKDWLKQGGNYGILCGKGLYEIDLDEPETQKQFEEKVETFTVQTGSGKGKHYYVMSDATENGTILSLPDRNGARKNLGNIQVKNKFVVGPNCIHYTGGKYEILKNMPFVWVSKAELEAIFGGRLVWAGHKQREDEEEAKEEANQIGFQIPISQIVDLNELKQIAGDEWQGAHPIMAQQLGKTSA